jgi:phytoene dehydrogenase-like protein
MAVASPFFRTLPLQRYGLEWIEPSAQLAHPFDDGTAAVVERSVGQTAAGLERDRGAYTRLFGGVVRDWPRLERAALGPLTWPRHPFALAAFGLRALRSAESLATGMFVEERTRALFGALPRMGCCRSTAR